MTEYQMLCKSIRDDGIVLHDNKAMFDYPRVLERERLSAIRALMRAYNECGDIRNSTSGWLRQKLLDLIKELEQGTTS